MTPHKHAALIKAWADGAEIQYRSLQGWKDISHPEWIPEAQYRIKPKTIKYRVALVGVGGDGIGTATVDNETQANELTQGTPAGLCLFGRFIKWIGDWQEVVVE